MNLLFNETQPPGKSDIATTGPYRTWYLVHSGDTNALAVREREDHWLSNVSAPFAVQLQVESFLNELLPLKAYASAELEKQIWNAAPIDASEMYWQLGLQASKVASKPSKVDGRLPSPWKDLPRGHLKLGSKKE